MKNEIKPVLINEEYLEDKIYIIRGQKVMLDSDLAKIYGYSTKDFNRQVKNNNNKFPSDFMFRLTAIETNDLTRCKNFTTIIQTKGIKGGRVYLPYVFTEQGIYMLMTVLRGELAIIHSIKLIRLFKRMKDYIIENKDLLPTKELLEIKYRTTKLEEDNIIIKTDLNKVINYFEDPNTYKHFLILDGCKLEADLAYKKIFKKAIKSIIYINDYVNLKTLSLLSLARNNVNITLITDNKAKDKITSFMINDFISQNKTNKLTLLKSNNKIHDRFIIIDFNTKNEKIYHYGSSLKDAGNKITTINELTSIKEYKPTINRLLKNQLLTLN